MRPELVVEVRYDKVQGHRFRHGTKFIRWRDDKNPADCTWRELRPPRDPSAPGSRRSSARPSARRGSRPRRSKRGRRDGGLRHMPRIGSPTASIRAAHRLQVNASGSTAATSSQRSGAETRASGVGRTEYADAIVRSRAFWPKSTNTPTRSATRHVVVATAGRRSAARPPRRAPWRSAARPGSGRSRLIGARMCSPVEPDVFGYDRSPSSSSAVAHDERDLADERPLSVGRRVEVDQQVVGLLDLRHARVPRVQLDAAEVRDPGERGGVVDDREHGRVPARELTRTSST